MPKPILKTPQQSQHDNILSLSSNQEQKQKAEQMDKLKLDRLLRQSRSKTYMQAIHKLDAGGHVHNKEMVNEIINAVAQEFPEVEITGILLGFVAVCYLGKPY